MRTGIMEVTVVGARALKNTEFFGKVDPYVVIQYKNQEQKSIASGRQIFSKFHMPRCLCMGGQGTSPVWDEKFKFKVEFSGGDEQHRLFLKIMDHDNITDDDYLGMATIYLKGLFQQGIDNGKAELHAQKYRVVSSNQTYQGEIEVGITFTATGKSDQQENGEWKG